MRKCAYINRILNMAQVLNMPNSEYDKVLNMAEFSICEHHTAL